MNTDTAHHSLPAHGLAALKVRMRTAMKRGALDRRLMAGEPAEASPELSRRAEKLIALDSRRGIAESLRETVSATLDPSNGSGSKISLNREGIEKSQDEILELAAILEWADLGSIRGVIMARRLLTDMRSPLYSYGQPGELREAVRHARTTLLID